MNNITATQKETGFSIPFTDLLSTAVCKCNGKQKIYLLNMSSLISNMNTCISRVYEV